MEFIDKALEEYCLKNTSNENELLAKISRETHLKVLSPRMLSGHLQGRFLSMLSKLQKPKNILEIGTYTGYSALCLAEGLHEGGKLITIDPNEETAVLAQKFFSESIYKSNIQLIVDDAKKIIPSMNEKFDLVFIDADKKSYSTYFDLVIDKVNAGGLIIADNVLWSGKVIADEIDMDTETKAIHSFNKKIAMDHRVEVVMLPVRDGLSLIRKK